MRPAAVHHRSIVRGFRAKSSDPSAGDDHPGRADRGCGKAAQLDAGTSPYVPRRLFNATLALVDDKAIHRPGWQKRFPSSIPIAGGCSRTDGMETTYRLKPNLTWHDGTPLTAEDFVFSWRMYSPPELGHANRPPMPNMDEVLAPDPRTVVVRWNSPYPGADSISTRDQELPPLPRHLLGAAFERQSMESFVTQSFWTRDYVGVGPYRVAQWEPGAFIEAAAFDNYALGRPKIDRIRLIFINDANTALANLMTGDADAGPTPPSPRSPARSSPSGFPERAESWSSGPTPGGTPRSSCGRIWRRRRPSSTPGCGERSSTRSTRTPSTPLPTTAMRWFPTR